MERKKILNVTTDMIPYFPENPMSKLSLEIPKRMRCAGHDVRIFMPRFGAINERRHQLHEVIRLSGMNLIIDDIDQPLIIKVASIPNERLQVYFIDNEEYFKRKETFADTEGNLFEDNDERAIFFAKGVLETLKKLNWKPDVVNVMGWMTCMLPLYMREYYADDPFFSETKIAVSITDRSFAGEINSKLIDKLSFDKIGGSVIDILSKPSHTAILKSALKYADVALQIDDVIDPELNDFISQNNIPVLNYDDLADGCEAYMNFFEEELLNH